MKYFLDTEFIEGSQKSFLGKTKPTIDLISIGIVSEGEDAFSKRIGKTDRTFNSREYYAISKDFNLKEAWNRFQIDQASGDMRNRSSDGIRNYWIRENVLKSIFNELLLKEKGYAYKASQVNCYIEVKTKFTYRNLKKLINKYGKTREQIAKEIHTFIYKDYLKDTGLSYPEAFGYSNPKYDPEFYAYYADYDWVAFCWLFGKMIDLPKGFPMYCKDLKQIMDEQGLNKEWKRKHCPNPEGEHNALVDAKWNYQLYKSIIKN